ncbi:hypothetical protein HMPREF9554_00320 [Treponema phagedenis F0421]|nr:hypothetical protein HMPREF9554_00320 [Treponema phagedenis F0421]
MTRTPVVPHRIEFENYHSALGVFKLIGLVLTWTSKTQNRHGWRGVQADGLVFDTDVKN